MKYDPSNHIIGKVYDLTQENMNAMLDYINELTEQIKKKESDKTRRDRDYMQIYNEHNTLMIRNNRFRIALEHYESAHYDSDGRPCQNDKTAHMALKGKE